MAREELDNLGVGHLLVVVRVHPVQEGVDVLVELLGIRWVRGRHIVDPGKELPELLLIQDAVTIEVQLLKQ